MPDRFMTEDRKSRLRSVLARRQPDLTLVLNNIHDPHNVSAILRSCDAFGVFGVHLYYTKEKFPSLANSSSGSAKKWIDLTRHRDAGTMIQGLRGQGMQIVGTGFGPLARPIMDIDFTRPTAIMAREVAASSRVECITSGTITPATNPLAAEPMQA